MGRTVVKLDPAVETPVVVVGADASDHCPPAIDVLHAPGVYVIDDYPWPSSLTDLQRFLETTSRAFDDPFSTTRPPNDVAPFYAAIEELLDRLYGGLYRPKTVRHSWRPMASRNEPLHFDSGYRPGEIAVTAYLNVSPEPRRYGISHTLPWLVKHAKKATRQAAGSPPYGPSRTMVALRAAGVAGLGPQAPSAPRHLVDFAPGSVWIFDPKMVGHELRYGTGAICTSWSVDARDAELLPGPHLAALAST